MDRLLKLIGRETTLFAEDVELHEPILKELIASSSVLVIGAAGTIGQAVVKEIFRRQPKRLHVVDISENNLVELVRDLRSSLGYTEGEFKTFALDIGSSVYDAFIKSDGQYDYVFNLSALKHVRSEEDAFTLMRMIEVNIQNTEKTLLQSFDAEAKKYFCVSTDKATNPVNMMGASKRIMEHFLMRRSLDIPVSTARFANVAFSDGSLLFGFNQRIQKQQPIAAPNDVRRYFLTQQEAGELCLLSCMLGENRDIFFPKLSEKLHLISFDEIAGRYLVDIGYEPVMCGSEEEARASVDKLLPYKQWPCYFSPSTTTGEKDFEEFFTEDQSLDLDRFSQIGVIKNQAEFDDRKLTEFMQAIERLKRSGRWSKPEILSLFQQVIPEFDHQDKGVYLDSKM